MNNLEKQYPVVDDEDFDDEEYIEGEYEDEFPPYGQPGAINNPDIHIKWICDSAVTLSEVSAMLRSYANYCEELENQGWQLSEPVDNSHGFVSWQGEDEPPPIEED